MMSPSVRSRRLGSDFDAVMKITEQSNGRLVVESTAGTPPDTYRLLFNCKSVVAEKDGEATFATTHHVRVYLPAAYPAIAPVATVLTPVLHPHIWPNRTVCLGPWNPAEKLDSVVRRIASMLVYDPTSFNWRSVADESIVPWAQRNLAHFPLDEPLWSAKSAAVEPAFAGSAV